MKRGRVVNLHKFNGVIKFLKENNILLIFTFLFSLGFFIGVFTLSKNSHFQNLSELFLDNYIDKRVSASFFSITVNSFFDYLLCILLFFILGSSMLGVIFVPLLLLMFGAFYGSVSTFLYCEYTLKGIAFNSIIILPTLIFFIICIIIISRDAFIFSFKLAKISFSNNCVQNISLAYKKFCIKYFIILIPIFIAALIDALISYNFISKFNL